MKLYKRFGNGLRLVVNKIEGAYSVSVGVLVKTGSCNESENENGISHFIEHVMFKGTKKRSAFEISDYIDRIGAQINAFTSKEMTCYYTKSTGERLEESIEVLSDIFFDSTFIKEELEKEKGVVIEEINMSEDTPEDLCFDLVAEGYYGKSGLGQTILGPAKNIRRFSAEDIEKYMDKYYTSDNVVISISGCVDEKKAEDLVKRYFEQKFTRFKSAKQVESSPIGVSHLHKYKKIEQSHVCFAMKGMSIFDEQSDAFAIANTVLGGGMSSRLFQKIREELGLAYSVSSFASQYKDGGILEIYGGLNTELRDLGAQAIVEEVRRFRRDKITEQEFLRAKEQLKSSTVFARESVGSQMLVHGKYLLFLDQEFDYDQKVDKLQKVNMEDVEKVIEEIFNIDSASSATIGPKKSAVKIH